MFFNAKHFVLSEKHITFAPLEINIKHMNEKKTYLVGTDNGMLLVNDMEFTTEIDKATRFDNIGDAMRECIRLNSIELGLTSKFRLIPYFVKEKESNKE